MISQKPIMHYLDYYKAWFNALHNAKQLTDMNDVYNKAMKFLDILGELKDADLISITIVNRYMEEVISCTNRKLNTYYN